MTTQTYMTAKLNLADGTIVYPQISLDNIVKSISDPTLVAVAQLDASSKVSISNLPVTTSVTNSNSTVPTNGAVYGALNTKQATLVEGDNIIHIINGSTIMADITNLDVAGIDQTATNGVHLVLDGGNTISAVAELAGATAGVAGTILSATNGIEITDGVIQGATPEEICGGTGSAISGEKLGDAIMLSDRGTFDPLQSRGILYGGFVYYRDSEDPSMFHMQGCMLNTTDGFQFKAPLTGGPGTRAGKYIAMMRVYDRSGSDITSVGMTQGWGIITGYPRKTSGEKNQWVTCAALLDCSSGPTTNALWVAAQGTVGTIADFLIKDFHILDVTNLDVSDYSAAIEGASRVYEGGDGINVYGKEVSIVNGMPSVVLKGLTTAGDPIEDHVVTPGNLRGALSIGQAVDVSCLARYTNFTQINWSDPTSADYDDHWENIVLADLQTDTTGRYLNGFGLRRTSATEYVQFMFTQTYPFPKFAEGLKYLCICDVASKGATKTRADFIATNSTQLGVRFPYEYCYEANNASGTHRLAIVMQGTGTGASAYATVELRVIPCGDGVTTAAMEIYVTNWRQYEVTALTDEAIAYLASLPNPDDFFRSADARSITGKYLVKQDMICPFIPTIQMSNSDLTVAAGLSYKMTYKSGTAVTRTITADTIPSNGYGWDTHLQLFVDSNTTVVFQPPLVLMTPLTANAGQNMTIKWRNGQALAYVDDTIVGYVVTALSGTTSGTLAYGLTEKSGSGSEQYVVFSHTIDGQTVTAPDTITCTANTTNIIGNGIENTKIDTGITAVSKPLTIQDVELTSPVVISRSKLTMRNCYAHDVHVMLIIDTLETQSVSFGGKYADITGCTFTNNGPGASGILNGWGMIGLFGDGTDVTMSDCLIDSCGTDIQNHGWRDLVFTQNGQIKNCLFINNREYSPNFTYGSVVCVQSGQLNLIENCVFTDTKANIAHPCAILAGAGGDNTAATCTISGSTFGNTDHIRIRGSSSSVVFTGTNVFNSTIDPRITADSAMKVVLDDASVLDLSGNTYSTVVSLGSGTVSVTGTASIIPYGKTEPISYSGDGSMISNSGALGYPVTTKEATGTGSLYDMIMGQTYTNVMFDPKLNMDVPTTGGSVAISGATFSKGLTLTGNRPDKTVINAGDPIYVSGNDTKTVILQNLTLTGSGFLTDSTRAAGFYAKDCAFTDINSSCVFAAGASAYPGHFAISGCTISGCTTSTYGFANIYKHENADAFLFKNNIVINCVHTQPSYGFVTLNYDHYVTGSTFTSVTGWVVSNTGTGGGNISDSVFTNCTSGIRVAGNNKRFTMNVSNCTLTNTPITIITAGAEMAVSGSIKSTSTIGGDGVVVIAPNTALDFTSNTNTNVVTGTIRVGEYVNGSSPLDKSTTPATFVVNGHTYEAYPADNKVIINGETVTATGVVLEEDYICLGGMKANSTSVGWKHFVEGGTASVRYGSGAANLHHFSGHGTYIQNAITGGTYSDLTEID